jgi:hypothetical protein
MSAMSEALLILAALSTLAGCATRHDPVADQTYVIVDDDPNAVIRGLDPNPCTYCKPTTRPFTACDMAKAAFTSHHPDTRRLGASWLASGACE